MGEKKEMTRREFVKDAAVAGAPTCAAADLRLCRDMCWEKE